jgi:outer membrane lipoprotein LolB
MVHVLSGSRRSALLALGAALLAAGCKQIPLKPPETDDALQGGRWAGRIGLQLQSEPPQAFFAGFELRGNPESGELTLTSPIGSVLGVLRWSPGDARLDSGGSSKRFASVDELLEQTTGAAVPLPALFDWLAGKNTAANGWSADLSQQPDGRITARRSDPAPQADLRIVLER